MTLNPQDALIDLSGDVERQCGWLEKFADAALTQAQEVSADESIKPEYRAFMAEFWLSEARHYRFEIDTARALAAHHRGRVKIMERQA